MKPHNEIMLTFRATRSMRDALEIIAKTNAISRSSLIRVLLVIAMREHVKVIDKRPQNNSKKAVDSKRTA